MDAASGVDVAALVDAGQAVAMPGGSALLGPDVCTIAPPVPQDAPSLRDADVLRAFVPYDDGSGAQGPGCVLDLSTFMEWMPLAKGWTVAEAEDAYRKLVSAGIASGDLRFFSTDILATPPGVQLVTGRCEDAPGAAALRASHDEIMRWFDPFIRAVGPQTPCRNGATVLDADGFAVMNEITGGTHVNAWLAFEVWLIAYGGGWYTFDGAGDRGTPRPPACGMAP
ncbi:hypothetical protein [Tateyamaria sp. SN6-1]|uniref:hypothetical protein n=1 Tax=Tateyamaria sp. SN6-1 TaxID=3092148 RepID=UPI0039F55B6C